MRAWWDRGIWRVVRGSRSTGGAASSFRAGHPDGAEANVKRTVLGQALIGDDFRAGAWPIFAIFASHAARARPLEESKGAVVGVEHYLLSLARIGPHEQWHSRTCATLTVTVTPLISTISCDQSNW
jgi:hypothetical protein